MKKYIIDRFEGKFAVCENYETEKMENILREYIPENAKDGDILIKNEDGTFEIDYEETRIRKEKIDLLRKSLRKNKEN